MKRRGQVGRLGGRGAGALLLVLFVVHAPPATAQEADRDLRLGFAAGASVSGFSGDGDVGWSSRTGLHAGLTLFHALDDRFSLQLGLFYVQKGAERPWGRQSVELDYVETPFLAGFRFNGKGTVSPRLTVGPSFGLEWGELVTALETVDCELYLDDPDCLFRRQGARDSSVDVALHLGAGVDIRLDDRKFLVLSLAYELGTRSLEERVGADVRNRTLLLQVGLSWRVAREWRRGGPVVPPGHP